MGHVGSLLVACCLTLPSLPESRPVPFTFSAYAKIEVEIHAESSCQIRAQIPYNRDTE